MGACSRTVGGRIWLCNEAGARQLFCKDSACRAALCWPTCVLLVFVPVCAPRVQPCAYPTTEPDEDGTRWLLPAFPMGVDHRSLCAVMCAAPRPQGTRTPRPTHCSSTSATGSRATAFHPACRHHPPCPCHPQVRLCFLLCVFVFVCMRHTCLRLPLWLTSCCMRMAADVYVNMPCDTHMPTCWSVTLLVTGMRPPPPPGTMMPPPGMPPPPLGECCYGTCLWSHNVCCAWSCAVPVTVQGAMSNLCAGKQGRGRHFKDVEPVHCTVWCWYWPHAAYQSACS